MLHEIILLHSRLFQITEERKQRDLLAPPRVFGGARISVDSTDYLGFLSPTPRRFSDSEDDEADDWQDEIPPADESMDTSDLLDVDDDTLIMQEQRAASASYSINDNDEYFQYEEMPPYGREEATSSSVAPIRNASRKAAEKQSKKSVTAYSKQSIKPSIHDSLLRPASKSSSLPKGKEVSVKTVLQLRRSARLQGLASFVDGRYALHVQNTLGARNLEAVNVEGDGNCLYRALALTLFHDEDRHYELRRNIHEFMSDNPGRYNDFRFNNLEEHLKEMKLMGRDREYGGENQLAAAARLFNVDLFVTADVHENGEYLLATFLAMSEHPAPQFYVVCHREGQHYYATRPN